MCTSRKIELQLKANLVWIIFRFWFYFNFKYMNCI